MLSNPSSRYMRLTLIIVHSQVLAKATENGLECTAVRLGQVCGSTTSGAWGTTEWVPILVKSSEAVGCLPDLSGVGFTHA